MLDPAHGSSSLVIDRLEQTLASVTEQLQVLLACLPLSPPESDAVLAPMVSLSLHRGWGALYGETTVTN